MKKYFPRGIAKGDPFFNREQELARLKNNINSGVHTVLIAPRRYGKSSLAKKAILLSKQVHAEIDLFVAIDEEDIGHKIIAGASSIIQQICTKPEQWFQSLRQYFKNAEKKWTIGIKGITLELLPNDNTSVAENILDILKALEHILVKEQKTAVMFIDEFQEILETKIGKAIEGAIRHFAQESEQLVFIFSGSNRKMLKKIFNDRSRPLYSLCDEIRLDRIKPHYYETYLQKIAELTYQAKLSKDVINEILALSECHPKYVYLLCGELWLRALEKPPTVKKVQDTWEELIRQKTKDIRMELIHRPPTQLKLMQEIARGNNKNLSGKNQMLKLNMTSSSIVQALKVLEELDYVEKLETGEYRLIDPLIKGCLILMQ